jgi:hypothetical protein
MRAAVFNVRRDTTVEAVSDPIDWRRVCLAGHHGAHDAI